LHLFKQYVNVMFFHLQPIMLDRNLALNFSNNLQTRKERTQKWLKLWHHEMCQTKFCTFVKVEDQQVGILRDKLFHKSQKFYTNRFRSNDAR